MSADEFVDPNVYLAQNLPELPCDLRWRLADQEPYQKLVGTRTLYLERKVISQKKRFLSFKTETVVSWEEVDYHPWTESEGLGKKTVNWTGGDGLYQIALYILYKQKVQANKPPAEYIPSGVTREA